MTDTQLIYECIKKMLIDWAWLPIGVITIFSIMEVKTWYRKRSRS